jgi:2-dehydro-3-deoxyphosphogluconate aldolase/(4S)-4-hydroxy-2-oxoglutarate aldolase
MHQTTSGQPDPIDTTGDVREALSAYRVLPVVVTDDPHIAQPLAEALLAGGLPLLEITLRTPHALQVLAALRDVPGVSVGAGSVLNAQEAEAAIATGARYLVTPGYSRTVNDTARQAGIPVIAGVATATEMMRALDDGHDLVKYFPAGAGGPSALKALAAPLRGLRFVPTGGITAQSAAQWLQLESVVAVGGSWMVTPQLLSERSFSTVTELARGAVALAAQSRTPGQPPVGAGSSR